MAQLELTDIQNADARHEMVMFPWTVYRGDKNWVPPVIEEREGLLDSTRNPFFQENDVTLLAARRDGRLVGTIATFINRRFNEHLNKKVGFFGFFEVLNDYEAAELLLGW